MIPLTRIRRHFPRPLVADIEGAVRSRLVANLGKIQPGASIAVAVGSRGIANLSRIVAAVVQQLREVDTRPFIVPAMGSHGGATAEGQSAVLESYGVTEAAMGCPIRSSMEVVRLVSGGLPCDQFMDRHAFEADGIVLINRIKPHTDFHGTYESGLVKMAVIGLGKERQASAIHQFGANGLKEIIPVAAKNVFASGKILAGVGIVENAYDETAVIDVIPGDRILEREPELLAQAWTHLPSLPVEELDVLIVDRLGKNISGTGMDTNVIGRIRIAGVPEPERPRIGAIVVAGVTPESHGNATGMGLADVVTRRFRDQIDFEVTNRNIITSGFLERGKLPLVAVDDREALALALRAVGCRDPQTARVIRIKDTLHLSEMLVSRAVAGELKAKADVEVLAEVGDPFDEDGNLRSF